MSQTWGALAPLTAAPFLKGLHAALWNAAAVGGTEFSLQAAPAAKHATRRLFQWPVWPSECA